MLGVLGRGVDVADVGPLDAHHGGDVAGDRLGALLAAQVVEGVELAHGRVGGRAVVLHDEDLVAVVHRARIDAADADAADEVVVVDVDDLHRERRVGVDLGGGHLVDDHVEQRVHVHVAVVGRQARVAVHGGGVHDVLHREGELLVGGAQVAHQVEDVVDDLLGTGAGAVDLVDDDHDGQARRDGVLQHEARLGHGTLERVDEQKRAVGHAQHALDLAAEVGVAGGVDDVDLDALVLDRDVLGQDGDAALALLVVGVEDAVLHLLVGAERVGGAQQLVAQRRLAVVDVGNDGDVPQVILAHRAMTFRGRGAQPGYRARRMAALGRTYAYKVTL